MKKISIHKPTLLLGLVVVALLFFAVLSSYYSPPTVTSITPQNNSSNVLDSTPIKLIFENPPTSSQLKNLTLALTPYTPLNLVWTDSVLTATPTNPLLPKTLYTITLSFREKPILTSTFTTDPYSVVELKAQAAQQILDDKIQADVEKAYYQETPWLRALPIETDSYRVIFDYETKRLRIRLLGGNTAEILPQILANLKAHQIDAPTIGYDLVY